MTLLEEIQNAAIDSKSDVGTLLRQCKVLAARLNNKPLENWVLWESNGYPESVSVPDYRIWRLSLRGHFVGGFGAQYRNAAVPLICLPKDTRLKYEHHETKQSIPNLENLLKNPEAHSLRINTGDLNAVLGNKVFRGYHCMEVWAEVQMSEILEIINAVRNRILDFSLAVQKEFPMAGETALPGAKAFDESKVTQIFQTIVNHGNANIAGKMNMSTTAINVTTNNLQSLKEVLLANGVAESDLAGLVEALNSEQKIASHMGYGPQVSSWIAKMTQKAANGTWEIGLAAAAALLAQAISKYYGVE